MRALYVVCILCLGVSIGCGLFGGGQYHHPRLPSIKPELELVEVRYAEEPREGFETQRISRENLYLGRPQAWPHQYEAFSVGGLAMQVLGINWSYKVISMKLKMMNHTDEILVFDPGESRIFSVSEQSSEQPLLIVPISTPHKDYAIYSGISKFQNKGIVSILDIAIGDSQVGFLLRNLNDIENVTVLPPTSLELKPKQSLSVLLVYRHSPDPAILITEFSGQVARYEARFYISPYNDFD